MKTKVFMVLGIAVVVLVIWGGVTVFRIIRGAPDNNIPFSLEIVAVSNEDSGKPKVTVQIQPSHYSGQQMLVACHNDTRILYSVSKDLDTYVADCTNHRGRDDVSIFVELFNSSGYSVALKGVGNFVIPECSLSQRFNPLDDCWGG